MRLAVRETVADNVGIHKPVEPPVFPNHNVGIPIQLQKRGQLGDPFHNVASPEQLAFRCDILVQDQIDIPETNRKEQPVPECHLDAGVGRKTGRRIASPLGEVKLCHFGAPDHIVIGEFSEVDLGLRQRQLSGRRKILEMKFREPIGGNQLNRRHGDTIAVGVDQLAVDPGLRLLVETVCNQFACRKHHLAHGAVNFVAVNVDVVERIVLAQSLHLVVGFEQRAIVPKTHVADRIGFGHQCSRRQLLGRIVLDHFDFFQIERRTGQTNVFFDKRPFQSQLVGADLEALHQCRVDRTRQDRHTDPDHQHNDNSTPGLAPQRRCHEQPTCHQSDEGKQRVGRQLSVYVCVTSPKDRAPFAVEQFCRINLIANGQQSKKQRAQNGQVKQQTRACLPATKPDAAHGCNEQQGRQQRRLQPVACNLQHRQAEQIETDVTVEDRVGQPEVALVEKKQKLRPLPCNAGPHQKREDCNRCDHRYRNAQPRCINQLFQRSAGQPLWLQTSGQDKIGQQKECGQQKACSKKPSCSRQPRPQNRFKVQAGMPAPVG